MLDFIQKFLLSYAQHQLRRLVGGRKHYEKWKEKNYSLKQVPIKNKTLAKELELACKKAGGHLTFGEYLAIDQFGANGYHATHAEYGRTLVHKNWAKALAILCKQKGYKKIVEFGPGEGLLAIETVKAANQLGIDLIWSGIEVNNNLQKAIREHFRKEQLQNHLDMLADSIHDVSFGKKCLALFPYSLDSVPPEIVINTRQEKSSPNALIGITVQNGILSEIVLPSAVLKAKGISLENGIYTDPSGISFDLNSWKLYNRQRAYLPLHAFSILARCAKKMSSDSLLIVIDEFRNAPFSWETGHLCLPRDLHTYTRDCEDLEKLYKQAGSSLFYYPIYFHTFLKFLHSLGFTTLEYDIEQKLAKDLSGEKWRHVKSYFFTYAFLASQKINRDLRIIDIVLPQTTML